MSKKSLSELLYLIEESSTPPGGIITLLNNDGLKIHGVQHNTKVVSEQGRALVF